MEVLYAADVRRVDAAGVLEEREPVEEYTRHVVEGVAARLEEIDALLEDKSVRWPVDRMSPVDRNVMRVAVFELLGTEVPPATAIDEAVELAKRLSGEDAARFVNGVLSGVLGALQASGGRSEG